ncbi:MAG TPA: metallophosphoesterase family protein [Patescibacteria group bacterium]|nr:metallophosphoesterase family protein [Patescibacteria group bacterium]
MYSDIHGKAENLDLLPDDDDLVNICLGDICAGDPEGAGRTIDKLMERKAICLYGSHNRPAVDDEALEWFRIREQALREEGRGNPNILRRFHEDAFRLRRSLGAEHLRFLSSLPGTHTMELCGKVIRMIHDSPLAKGDLTKSRILNVDIARANFESPSFTGDILLVGHSHVPLAFREYEGEITETVFDGSGSIEISEGRYILNPGSIQRLRAYPKQNQKTAVFKGADRISYGILDLVKGRFDVRFIQSS